MRNRIMLIYPFDVILFKRLQTNKKAIVPGYFGGGKELTFAGGNILENPILF
jgi:hypothetical protein